MNTKITILSLLFVMIFGTNLNAQESDATYEETVEWLNKNISKTSGQITEDNSLLITREAKCSVPSYISDLAFKCEILAEWYYVNHYKEVYKWVPLSKKSLLIEYLSIINVETESEYLVLTFKNEMSEEVIWYDDNGNFKSSEKSMVNSYWIPFDQEDYNNKRILKALKHLAYLNNQNSGEKF